MMVTTNWHCKITKIAWFVLVERYIEQPQDIPHLELIYKRGNNASGRSSNSGECMPGVEMSAMKMRSSLCPAPAPLANISSSMDMKQ
jgi:hypothetical protein